MAGPADDMVEVEVLDGPSAPQERGASRRDRPLRAALLPRGGAWRIPATRVRGARGAPHERPGEDHVGPPRRRPVHRGARLLAGIVCAGLAAVGTLTVLEQRAGAERRSLLAGVEGLAPRLDGPPSEVWRIPVRHGVDVHREVVLTYEWHQGGVDAVVAHDPLARRALWRAPLPAGSRVALVDCVGVVRHGDGRAVVCQVFGSWEVDLRPATSARTREAFLLYLDLETGEALERRAVGSGASAVVVDEDLVTLTYGRDDVVVQRRDTDGARWVARLPRPAGDEPPVIDLRAQHGAVLLHGAVTAALDAESGALLMSWPAGLGRWEDAPFAGIGARPELVWTSAPVSRQASSVVRPDDRPPQQVVGRVTPATVDDGSEPGVLLLESGEGELVAVDLAATAGLTSAAPSPELWRVPAGRRAVLLRMDGRAVLGDLGQVRSIDVRTGEEIWSRTLGPADEATTVTDGEVVLVLRYEVAVGRLLSALDLDTGQVLWETPMPERTQRLVVVDGMLVAIGGSDVVVLG